MRRPTDELRRSERYLNYAKTVGALVAATAGVFGMVIAVWHPSEPMAKASYRVVEKTVSGLSEDVHRAYEDRKLIKERMDLLQGQMTLLLDTMHAYMEARPAPRRSLRRRRSSKTVPSKPAQTLLEEAIKKQQEASKSQEKRAYRLEQLAQPPPQRQLPAFQKVQEQAAAASSF